MAMLKEYAGHVLTLAKDIYVEHPNLTMIGVGVVGTLLVQLIL